MNIDNDMINKGLETAKNVSKFVANITDSKPQQRPPQEKKQENLNQPHNQTVEVKVGDAHPGNPKPTVIREKNETHVHKVYPDQRELSDRECDVETLRIQTEHERKMRELSFRMEMEMENRRERKEREEYERKERERRRERDRKFTRNMCIGIGAAGLIAVGCAAFDFYTNSRNSANRGVALQQPRPAVTGEGTVA